MRLFILELPSPRENELYFRTDDKPPKGWHAVKVSIDWDLACPTSYGHEMGLSEEILLRRLVMARTDWHGVPDRHPRPSAWIAPETAEFTLYLTNEEFNAFSKVAGTRGISWLANAIIAAVLWDGQKAEEEGKEDENA